MLNNNETIDLAALESLLAAAMPAMRQAVARVLKGADAEDCVQSAALKVWANPERFLAAKSFKSLATTTAYNTAIDWTRLAANSGGRFSHEQANPTDYSKADDRENGAEFGITLTGDDGRASAERFAELDALHKAISAALDAEEEIFVLALLDGKDGKDAAKAAGWSASKASRNRDSIMERLAAKVAYLAR